LQAFYAILANENYMRSPSVPSCSELSTDPEEAFKEDFELFYDRPFFLLSAAAYYLNKF